MANNKVTIYIHNQRYRFLAEENEDYLQQCADIVNKEMDNAMDGNTLSITDGAVLAAMNVADKYCKERLVSDNLRAQLKQALDENARLAKEMSREARKATKEKAKAKREAKTEAKAESEGKAEDAQPAPAESQEAQAEEST